ncbi:MAG: hypothetical protein J0M00_25915, partial [Burkholderiales bacterium]|nr:hypothetical protein [Burkholderiales bacterium]
NGYYLEIGENGSADALRLFRQDGAVRVLLATGLSGFVASEPVNIRLKVKRNATGAWAVEAPAYGIERSLKAGLLPTQGELDALRHPLERLLDALDAALPAAPPPLAPVAGPITPDPRALALLQRQLLGGDADGLGTAERLAPMLRVVLGGQHAEFERHLRQYAFAEAAALLESHCLAVEGG